METGETTTTEQETVDFPSTGDPITRFNFAFDSGVLLEDGTYEVKRQVRQIVSFDNKFWFIREFAVKSLDSSFKKANLTTHKSANAVIAEYEGNFFSKQEWPYTQYVLKSEAIAEVLRGSVNGTTYINPKDR